MAMRRGKVPPEVMAVFEKYMKNNVRNLKKDQAMTLFSNEFGLDEEQSEIMFHTFDKDMNGIMSIWEFQQFFMCMGDHCQEVIAKFKEIDADGSGKLDADEAKEGLKSLKTATGRNLEEKEIEFFLKSAVGEDGLIDLGAFTNLLYTLKLYKAPAPKK
ncbi:uncharacterized protein LOC128235141 [Mya arenaria]|uniref:uncharacterized protein LOC128233910 n=1 Tax=Mya arenaria TaxID=6604 RepID=UPI0022E81B7A|nr:uncharacterized protein LOC128233910 [Mya arenaria]XP_052805843.1 uncharacterized protein LOC128235141 [Mya arenaria]